jgi:hypothetical protein
VSGQAGRYQRSAGGLVGSMIVLGVLLVAFVGIRSLTDRHPDTAVRVVDYAKVVAPAKQQADFHLVAPSALPTGWRATSAGFDESGGSQHWHLGVLTDQDRYVGLEQGDDTLRSMVSQYVDEQAERGKRVDVAGRPWTTYTDSGGDLALVRSGAGATTLVVGHDVPQATLVAYAASLR